MQRCDQGDADAISTILEDVLILLTLDAAL